MPVIFGTNVTAATYVGNTLTVDGEAFAANQYVGVSAIETAPAGTGVWTAATITSWADTQVIGTITLTAGTYDVRVTSSDGEQDTLAGAFVVSGGGSVIGNLQSKMKVAISISI